MMHNHKRMEPLSINHKARISFDFKISHLYFQFPKSLYYP